MARLVACPQCGSTHRSVAEQTRFTCDYCQNLVVVDRRIRVEEFVVPARVDVAQARAWAQRWLEAQGVVRPQVVTQTPTQVPYWHVSSGGGEEATLPAVELDSTLLRRLSLPALPVVARDQTRGAFDQLPVPTVTREEAEATALASFRETDPSVVGMRLVWIPVVPLRARANGDEIQGFFLCGTDKVMFEPIPASARCRPGEPTRLMTYASFAVLALVMGMSVAGFWPRALGEGGLVALALVAWTAWDRRPGSGS